VRVLIVRSPEAQINSSGVKWLFVYGIWYLSWSKRRRLNWTSAEFFSSDVNKLNVTVRIQGFGGETRRKETSGGPSRRWEDNIKMVLQEVGYGGMDWIELVQDRDRWRVLVNAAMNLWIPQNTGIS
jgi:hypothetical protein